MYYPIYAIARLKCNMEGRYVSFNKALNTFRYGYIGVGHVIAENHTDSETGNSLPPLSVILFRLTTRDFLCAQRNRQDNT